MPNNQLDSKKSDVLASNKFSIYDQHSDVTPQDFSERWFISLFIDSKTLQKTT